MKFRGTIFNYGNPQGPHERCPHISRKGKPCKKHAGHGRHILTEGTTKILGFDYHWIRLAYMCECGFASSRRDAFKKWHENTGRLWMLQGRRQAQLTDFEKPHIQDIPQEMEMMEVLIGQ